MVNLLIDLFDKRFHGGNVKKKLKTTIMEKRYNVLTIGKRGCYIVMSPDFERCTFDPTNEIVKAKTLTNFGFEFGLKESLHSTDKECSVLSEEGIRQKVFKNFWDKIQKEISDSGADYILVSKLVPSFSKDPYTLQIMKCQLLVKTDERP